MAMSKRRYLKRRVSKRRVSKRRASKRRVSKRRVSKRRASKRRVSKRVKVKNQKGRGYIKLFNSNNLIGKEATIQGYGIEYHPYYPGSNLTGDTYDTSCEAKVSKAMPMCK